MCESVSVCSFVLFLPNSQAYLHFNRKVFLLFPESSNTGLLTDFYELKIPPNSTLESAKVG